jgi:hypothetical protein
MRNPGWALVILAAVLLTACKSDEERLDDLDRSTDQQGRLDLTRYDAGALVHEGFQTAQEMESLSLARLGKLVHDCGLLLEGNEYALCRADAVATLTRVALAAPIASIDQALEDHPALNKHALAQIEILDRVCKCLDVPRLIAGLGDGDRTVVLAVHRELKEVTGESFPATAAAWQTWWEKAAVDLQARAANESRQPLEILGKLRYPTLAQARSVLGYVSARMASLDLPSMDDLSRRAILRIARQVVVLGLIKALDDKDAGVRWDACEGMLRVRDPRFGEVLSKRWMQERDAGCQVKLLEVGAHYPSRRTLEMHLFAMLADERAVRLSAREGLVRMTGVEGPMDAAFWTSWYERQGRNLWP